MYFSCPEDEMGLEFAVYFGFQAELAWSVNNPLFAFLFNRLLSGMEGWH